MIREKNEYMHRDQEDYLLSTEGINGLRLITRDSIPAKREKQVKGNIINAKGDRRYCYRTNSYIPLYDYLICGEERPALVVREVESEIETMKKYALIEMRDVYPDKPKGKIRKALARIFGRKEEMPDVEVFYVYSEGIDIEKMITDPEYAEMIMKLLTVERLERLRSPKKNCYIGTIGENDSKYCKMIRPNPLGIVTEIETIVAKQWNKAGRVGKCKIDVIDTRKENVLGEEDNEPLLD